MCICYASLHALIKFLAGLFAVISALLLLSFHSYGLLEITFRLSIRAALHAFKRIPILYIEIIYYLVGKKKILNIHFCNVRLVLRFVVRS